MADIALSWPRLICPALALRQAAPWRWKMSATSSLVRRTAAGLRSGSRPPFGQRREPVERAGHCADRGVAREATGGVPPSVLGYSLRLLRPGAVAARRDVVGALHARQAPNDRHAAPSNGIGRDNRLCQGDPPLIAARVRAGHNLSDLTTYTLQVVRVGDLVLAPIS